MPQPFSMGIAGLTAGIFPAHEYLYSLCADYIVDVPPTCTDLTAISSPEDIADIQKTLPVLSDGQAESLSIQRQLADQLPLFEAFVFHGAAIEYDGKAYLFTAPSGTGKSTHIRLWRTYLGEAVNIVNGDKPILRLSDDGVNVCSAPWAGKEQWQRNCIVPLGGICLLRRGRENRIASVNPADYLSELVSQTYVPKNGNLFADTLTLLDRVCDRVPFYVLDCDISETAVQTAFEAMTGKRYEECAVK